MRKALFIGGTGTISMAITKLVASTGEWELTLLNRGRNRRDTPRGVETLVGDIADADGVEKLLGNREFDVVADFIAFTPAEVERDAGVFAGRTGQYIFISSASAYQKPVASLPITESTPLKNPYWQYSRDKIACEDLLTRLYREEDFPMTIVRPSHTYANRNMPVALHGGKSWQVLARMREGKPVVIPGDGTSLWTLTHADDFAPGFLGLMANPRAIGHAVHITSDDVLTWNQIYGCIADALGVPLTPAHVSCEELIRHNPELAGPLLGDKANSVIFDNAKIRSLAPLFHPSIRFSDAARRIVRTVLADPDLQPADPVFDAWCDKVIGER